MSLLTVIGNEYFISVMSDGRIYDGEKEKVYKDDYQKFLKVSDKVIIGMTGSAIQSKSLFEIANYWFEKAGQDINKFVEDIREVILEDVPLREGVNITMHVMVCGKNRLGKSSVFTFTNDPKVGLESGELKKNGYVCLGDNRAARILDEKTDSDELLTLEEAIKIQGNINDKIAELTPETVNKVTFQDTIYIQ